MRITRSRTYNRNCLIGVASVYQFDINLCSIDGCKKCDIDHSCIECKDPMAILSSDSCKCPTGLAFNDSKMCVKC